MSPKNLSGFFGDKSLSGGLQVLLPSYGDEFGSYGSLVIYEIGLDIYAIEQDVRYHRNSADDGKHEEKAKEAVLILSKFSFRTRLASLTGSIRGGSVCSRYW